MGKNEENEIKYRVIYSDRRTVGISIKDGEVIVRAPRTVSSSFIKKIVSKHSLWIKKSLEKQEIRRQNHPEPKIEDEAELRADAKLYFTAKTEEYSKIMGLKYGRISITGAKKRFGSCNSHGNICYSFRAMTYPEKFREYLVVHELCHLVYMNHSKDFYALVAKYMPDYKERKRLAK